VSGAWVTVQLTAWALTIGSFLGLLLAVARLASVPPLRWAAYAYIEFFRTTPPLVQIVWVYFGLPVLIGREINSFEAAVIALGLNIAAFMSEIIRSGLQGIDAGQRDAARVLGLGMIDTFRFVLLPQAFRIVLPPLGATAILLLKGTSLASAIGLLELTRVGQLISSATYRPFETLTAVALLYFAICYPIANVTRTLENRFRQRA
jgi:His/Glu/Gln/Arg/opine family amino acid ABC transporter permease subunit